MKQPSIASKFALFTLTLTALPSIAFAQQNVTIQSNGQTVRIHDSQTVTVKQDGKTVVITQNGAMRRNKRRLKPLPPVGRSIIVNGNNLTRTYVCNNNGVVVNGNNNHLTLRGTCVTLTLNGNNNTVRTATVANIAANGNNNRATWARTLGGVHPNIEGFGNGNRLMHVR